MYTGIYMHNTYLYINTFQVPGTIMEAYYYPQCLKKTIGIKEIPSINRKEAPLIKTVKVRDIHFFYL
jgi:hypothetical protein